MTTIMDSPLLPSSSHYTPEHPFETLDACPDSVRAAVIERMHAALAADATPDHAETPLVVPGDQAPHPTPPLLIGSIWRQLNSLRVMRQYCHTLSRMCREYAFLRGHSITCVHGLEWFSSLNQPMLLLNDGVRAALEDMLTKAAVLHKGMSRERLAYEIHSRLPCPDRDLLRLTIGMHFPGAREYEVDICRHMMTVEGLSYDKWLARFFTWRSAGLYYPLAVAARRMASPEQWPISSQLASTPVYTAFFEALKSLSAPKSQAEHFQALATLVSTWEEDNTGATHALAGTLDRLAVLMRVKSNGRRENPLDFSLDDALDAFPVLDSNGLSSANSMFPSRCADYSTWRSLKAAVEDVFPPSTLCAPLTRPRRSTWGFSRLTLELLPGPTLRFKERALGLVPGTHDIAAARQQQQQQPQQSLMAIREHSVTFADDFDADHKEQEDVDPTKERSQHPSALFSDCLAAQTSNRVQDVLWRMGELLLTPDIALCMLYPTVALASLDGASDPVWQRYSELCLDREHLLECMCPSPSRGAEELLGKEHFTRYIARLEASLPPVHCIEYDRPREALLWRVDIPQRLLFYVGEADAMHPAASSRHTAKKILINGKSPVRTVGRIAMLLDAASPCSEIAIRTSLRKFAAASLLQHPGNVVLVKGYGPVTSTTLAETLSSFALSPVQNPTLRLLGQPPPRWGGDSIDERYAEKQTGSNGFRFRDWIAMHANQNGTHQSRLAAHVVRFSSLYHTKLPWLGEDGRVRWVRMACTTPPENRTLQGRTLRQAVESRYMHDLRMLPVRTQGDTVLRANAEIYTEGQNSVAIAYATTGGTCARLELIAFQFPCNEGPYEGI